MIYEVYDIESYEPLYLYVGLNWDTGELVQFEVSEFKNELLAYVKYMTDTPIDYQVSFNGLNYDAQVTKYILDNYEKWIDLSGLEVARRIRKWSDHVIEQSRYELKMPYSEFSVKQCDVFRIHHFDNDARRTSLKWTQFSTDYPNVEESPIPFDAKTLSQSDIEKIVQYCINDVLSLNSLFKLTLGQTENPLYKNRNKIQDRLDIMKDMGFGTEAMNWSDVKIGDMINLSVYKKLARKTDSDIWDMKRDRVPRRGFKFGDCIPAYVRFTTPEFQEFHKRIKKERVVLSQARKAQKKKKAGFPFTYNGTTYIVAQGGIHSNERNRSVIPKEGEILRDADIGSQYPWSIIKRRLFPAHLGPHWLTGYEGTFNKRISYKRKGQDESLSAEDRRMYAGLSEMYKLSLNGGGFGKLNERTNWQYDPFAAFSCTIGNQFEILMLCEMMEVKGIHVVSANTDGIVCLFPKELDEVYYAVCKEWEVIVGNSEKGKLEYTDYSKLIQSSVNDYIAVKVDGKVKKKGDFGTDYEIQKNKSRRIIPIALENYYIKGIPVEQTVMRHRNIFDFCVGVKASKDFHYESFDREGKAEVYHRLVRYYVSRNGRKLMKIKNEGSESTANPSTALESGEWLCTVANQIDSDDDIRSYDINYTYYINRTLGMIRSIQGYNKNWKPAPKEQLTLF